MTNVHNLQLSIQHIIMLIGLVSLILYVRERWVDETGCLRAIGFLNEYNKLKLSYINRY